MNTPPPIRKTEPSPGVDPAPRRTPDPVPEPEPKNKGGRPKGSKTKPKMPTKHPEPRHGNEKPPPALEHPDRAVETQAARLDALIAAARTKNPEKCGHWQSTAVLFKRHGASVPRSAWRPLVSAPVRATEYLCGVDPAHRLPDEEIDVAAESWQQASPHLGLSEPGAAWLGAIAGTIGTVGLVVARAVVRGMEKRKAARAAKVAKDQGE